MSSPSSFSSVVWGPHLGVDPWLENICLDDAHVTRPLVGLDILGYLRNLEASVLRSKSDLLLVS